MKIVHIVAGLAGNNGIANAARMFAAEGVAHGDEVVVTNDLASISRGVDAVCVHGAWLPLLWMAARRTKAVGARLLICPAGSYDPVRLAYHGWKKKLVAPFEHRMLLRADVLLATCEAEAEWIRAYEPRVKAIEITDLKRFFDLNHVDHVEHVDRGELHLLYLGRRHPLKGLEYLEPAVRQIQDPTRSTCSTRLKINFCIVSDAFGDELEKVWNWCDVLVLPTLSENFGLVIAEALERGKRVVTTDGAPAWGESLELRVESVEFRVGEIWSGYGGKLLYLKGYREGSPADRVCLLKESIASLVSCPMSSNK